MFYAEATDFCVDICLILNDKDQRKKAMNKCYKHKIVFDMSQCGLCFK